MTVLALVTLLALCGFDLTFTRPTGAPSSACVSMTPGHRTANRASGRPSEFTVDTVGHGRIYSPGVPLQVRVTGPLYQGLILQARKTDGSSTPQGTWTSVPSSLKTIFCSAPADTVTHSDSTYKLEPVFQWTPQGNIGPVKFVATVAKAYNEWWTGIESPALNIRDYCANSPCMNGGSCLNSGTFYTCSCTSQWMGDRCETRRSLTPGPVPPPSGGQSCGIDMVFLLDTSGGAMAQNADQPLKQFVENVANMLPSGSRVGVISYGDNAEKTKDWDDPNNQDYRTMTLRSLSATNTDKAFDLARTDYFNSNNGNRRMAILISEGPRANNKLQTYRNACLQVKNMAVKTMVIGVLIPPIQSIAFSEMNCHYDQSYFETISDYSRLNDMNLQDDVRNLINAECSGGGGGGDACSSRPCMNGASCRIVGNGFECTCQTGWTGTTCADRDACTARPCRNGGSCRTVGNNFECTCAAGWTGSICADRDTGLNPCSSNPCRNSGTCLGFISSFSFICSCVAGWTGRTCEQRIQVGDPCNPNPCRSGGTCYRMTSTSHQCVCRSGFSGNNCEQSQDPCSSSPCANGNCRRNGNTYSCSCFSGWSGNRCDISSQDQCSPNPCMNGGTCMRSGNSYRCTCTSRYTGSRCDRMVQQDTDVNEVYAASFEGSSRFGEMRNENGGKDQLDWRTTNGRKKPIMGPMKDASEDNSQGNYAYIMYDKNTDFMGKTARYMTQPLQQRGAMCMEFNYWMTGGWDKLRVLVQRTNGQVIGVGEFKGTDNLHTWVRGQVNIEEETSGSVVILEARPYFGYSLGSKMIALDDVKIFDGGYCDIQPAVEGYYYRIVDGPTPFEGRVEVSRYNTTDDSMWGGLCMNGFGTLEAQLLCQKLFPTGEQILGFRPGRTISLGDYGSPTTMVQDNINCMGKNSLDECMTSGWMETSCTLEESAKVRCDQPEFYYVGNEIRLADYTLDENAKTFSGRVELYYNGEWGTVCSNGFDQVDAQAVCNTIGFTGPARANLNGANGQGTGRVFLENVNCPRDAVEFTQCLQGQNWQSSCRHSQDVGVTCAFESKNIEWNCNFENNNNCGFYPYSMNNFEWMVGRPPVGSPRGSRSMYASLSSSNSNNVMSVDALYDFSGWITPMFEAFPTTDFLCVRFWYNPYDIRDAMGSDSVFTVYMKMGRNYYPKFWLDARDIGVNRQWTEAYFTISDASAPFKLKFVAKKLIPAGRQSYIMVDDIRVTEGSCTGEGYITTQPGSGMPPPPTGTPTTPGDNCPRSNVQVKQDFRFECDFESNDASCGGALVMQGTDNINDMLRLWNRQTVNTPSSDTGPAMGNDGPGYIHLEASNIGAGNTAVARLRDQLTSTMDYCLSFDYHMLGPDIDKLRIGYSNTDNYGNINQNERSGIVIYELQGERGNNWNAEQVDIRSRTLGAGYLYLLAVRGNGYQGDVSLDNVKLRQGQCCPNVCASNLPSSGSSSANIYNCDFQGQNEGCCFRNCPDAAPKDQMNRVYGAICGTDYNYSQWVRVQGGTSDGRSTTPGSGTDYYLGINEGGEGNGEPARLFTGMIDLKGGSVCLKMKVYSTRSDSEIQVGIVGNNQPIRTIMGRGSRRWENESVTINGGMVQIYINGRERGEGMLFIDDIMLTNGRC